VRGNLTYWPPTMTSSVLNVKIGYQGYTGGNVVVTDNRVSGGTNVFQMQNWNTATITGNTFHTHSSGRIIDFLDATRSGYTWGSNVHYRSGSATAWYLQGKAPPNPSDFGSWKSAISPLAATDQNPAASPPTNWVILHGLKVWQSPSDLAYEGNLIIYNWLNTPNGIPVYVCPVLSPGEPYEIYNVQSIAWPILTGILADCTITIPLTAVTPPQAVGRSGTIPTTGNAFHAFWLRRR